MLVFQNALTAVNSNIANTVSNLNTTNNTVATINNNLSTKQNKLTIQTAGAGAPAIDALNNVRNIFGVSPISVLLYFDPFNPTNAMNNNIQLSFDNTLTNLTNYYTSTVSDAKYQFKLTTTTPLNLANNILSIDLSNYPTLTNLSTALANLVDSAPAALDTLKELATALNDDPNFATTITNLIGAKQSKITVVAPLALSVANYLSIDLSSYSTTSTINNLSLVHI